MRLYIPTFLASTFLLVACDSFTPEKVSSRYAVVPLTTGSAVLMDQITGETWQLSELGWAPIKRLIAESTPDDASAISSSEKSIISANDIKAERDRRKNINQTLIQSADAKRIVQEYKDDVLSQENARKALQALLPPDLGVLPPSTELGVWQEKN